MAGIIITLLALVTGLPLAELGGAAAWLSVPATLAMAACIPWFLPPADGGWSLLPQVLGGALFVSLVALGTTLILGVALAGMLGGLALMLVLLLMGSRQWRHTTHLFRDLLPFGCILLPLLLVNTVPGLKELTYSRWVFQVSVVPIHRITLTPFFSAYLYLFAALGVALFLFRSAVPLSQVIAAGLKQGGRALTAMALFGAMGQIIAYSGYGEGFAHLEQASNIPWVLAMGLKIYTGAWYPLFVPLLGWAGTFLTGYGVASLMLFGELQVHAAELLGVSAVWLAAGLTVGASIGSISSPFKIAIATPMCGALGQEGEILRRTIPLGVAASFLLGIILLFL
jgi:lactate permease